MRLFCKFLTVLCWFLFIFNKISLPLKELAWNSHLSDEKNIGLGSVMKNYPNYIGNIIDHYKDPVINQLEKNKKMKETWVPMVRPYIALTSVTKTGKKLLANSSLRPLFSKGNSNDFEAIRAISPTLVKWIISPRIWVKFCFQKNQKRNHLKKTLP